VGFLGPSLPWQCFAEKIGPTRRAVVPAENFMVRSADAIEASPPSGGGSTMVHEANLAMKGPSAVLAPSAGAAFRRIGDRAADGLRTPRAA
jgi:hypothetical protein